jgi:two-component system sensor histidine kinase SenX3
VGPWLLLVAGVVVGACLATAGTVWMTRRRAAAVAAPPLAPRPAPDPGVPPGAAEVLAVLRSSAVLVGPGDVVVRASGAAHELGLVRGDRLVEPRLRELVAQVRHDGVIRDEELVVRRDRLAVAGHLTARVARLDDDLLLVLVEDRTRERRLDEIRRDFVANVSHELKTPVGAMALLAEAVLQAADDPDAVRRFAARMEIESERLGRLVKQVIELSRLQHDELLDEPERVDVDALVAYAMDRSRTDAEARDIRLVGQTSTGLAVRGSVGQLQVALGNLVENAVAYSDPGTRVAITAKAAADNTVAITVADQGVGIPEAELDRIFERFYRVDPARATTTGGTGLGLSIVKHVAASHGGEIRVWSVPRTGSSFTLALPDWDRPAGSPPADTPVSPPVDTSVDTPADPPAPPVGVATGPPADLPVPPGRAHRTAGTTPVPEEATP